MEQENKEKQGIQYYHLLFIFSLLLITLFIFFYFLLDRKIENISIIENIPIFNELQESNNKYILKEYNGKIGIFENEALIYTLDTYIFTLPQNDKKLLDDGIEVSTKEELYDLLEEYY